MLILNTSKMMKAEIDNSRISVFFFSLKKFTKTVKTVGDAKPFIESMKSIAEKITNLLEFDCAMYNHNQLVLIWFPFSKEDISRGRMRINGNKLLHYICDITSLFAINYTHLMKDVIRMEDIKPQCKYYSYSAGCVRLMNTLNLVVTNSSTGLMRKKVKQNAKLIRFYYIARKYDIINKIVTKKRPILPNSGSFKTLTRGEKKRVPIETVTLTIPVKKWSCSYIEDIMGYIVSSTAKFSKTYDKLEIVDEDSAEDIELSDDEDTIKTYSGAKRKRTEISGGDDEHDRPLKIFE